MLYHISAGLCLFDCPLPEQPQPPRDLQHRNRLRHERGRVALVRPAATTFPVHLVPRKVSIVKSMEARAKRLREARVRASVTVKRRKAASAASAAAH